jgi:penicillin amidase
MFRWLRWLFVWPDARPADAPPRTWPGWTLTFFQGLFGISTWARANGSQRWAFPWLLRTVQGMAIRLVLLVGLLGLSAYLVLRGSLPDMDGTRTVAGLASEVRIDRDAMGIPTIHAKSRADLFFGMGYLHAQERYFQMDLSRRFAAGELAALLGPGPVPEATPGNPNPKGPVVNLDEGQRALRLRETSRAFLARMNTEQRAEVDAYVAGVNAGLGNLSTRPFEYLLLGVAPEPWTAEDTGLVVLAITIDLQADNWYIEQARGRAHGTLPPSLYALLDARGIAEWDAPLRGEPFATPRLPTPEEFDVRKEPRPTKTVRAPMPDSPLVGSNNWAVAGNVTKDGRAILACDMHLELRVPTVWYRAGLEWPGRDGQTMHAWGATYPGTSGLVVGSNEHVAWGLTNAEVDTSDLVIIETDPADPTRYRTPDGFEPFEEFTEIIHVSGGKDVPMQWRSTRWGPVLPSNPQYALHWVAQQPEGLNLGWLDLLEAHTLDEALSTANRIGGPHQNFVAVDREGNIGWTILGRLPRRVGFDGRVPVSWADGNCRWDGFYPPEQNPRVVRPAEGRIWTANNRVVSGADLDLIGEAAFDKGARARQIRDALRALDKPTEKEVFAIALDDRALFLARWRDLLLKVLDRTEGKDREGLDWMRKEVAASADRAGVDSIGFRLVLEFRDRVTDEVLRPLTARCAGPGQDFPTYWFRQREGAVWKILQERPVHLLDPAYTGGWDELLSKSARAVLFQARRSKTGLEGYTWGSRNVEHTEHPMSGALRGMPWVGGWLGGWVDMPRRQSDGAAGDMPRVQAGGHGASERMTVSPGHEAEGYFHMPCGQSGHPLSPHYRDMHAAWQNGEPTPFLPGATVHTLTLRPR